MADDLLSFVQALDAADEEAIGGHFADPMKKGRKRPILKPLLNRSSALSLHDLEDDQVPITSSRKRQLLSVPLAPTLRRKVEQEIAYGEAKKDVSKWSGVIKENRNKESLQFPRNIPVASEPSVGILRPQNEFEKTYFDLVSKNNPGTKNDASDEHSLEHAFPFNKDAAMKDVEDAQTRAKKRSDSFFRDRKAAHHARIKSKKYRKMLARDRKRTEAAAGGSITDKLLQANDPVQRQKKKEQRIMERVKERLTLKTRKANQWASEMLLHRHSQDPASRQEIMDQVRSKDILRKEIMGHAEEEDSDQSEDSDISESYSEDDMRDITGDVSENEEETVGRISFKKPKISENSTLDFTNEDVDDNNDKDSEDESGPAITKPSSTLKPDFKPSESRRNLLISKMNQKASASSQAFSLLRAQIQSEQPNAEFELAKQAEQSAEAPQTKDVTLPGWGGWTGPGYAAVPKTRITTAIPGTSITARRDAKLAHVIITEKRAGGMREFQADKVPFPFGSRKEYEDSLEMGGLGLEWNTEKAHVKKIAPRINKRAGLIIDPIKFKSK